MLNIILPFEVIHSTLTTRNTKYNIRIQDSYQFYATFDFSGEWDTNQPLYAVFRRDTIEIKQELVNINNKFICIIPNQIMKSKRIFTVSVSCGDTSFTNQLCFYVDDGDINDCVGCIIATDTQEIDKLYEILETKKEIRYMALDYAKAYQSFIDEELCAASVTAWMVAPEGSVSFDGGRDIQIAELSTTGLGSYDATKTDGSAFPQGAITNKWRSYSLFMDRAVQFNLDRMSPSDTGFVATVENVIREFTRTKLVRELDTYRLCKLYNTAVNGAYSSENCFHGAISADNIIGELNKTVCAAQNSAEQLNGFVAIINQNLYDEFIEAAGTNNLITFGKTAEINGVKYENVMYVGNVPCIFAPSNRMVTDVAVLSGRDDETEGGVKKSDSGKYINFIVALANAPLGVSKIESIKQFPPEENPLFDGTAIQLRYLYDLFVPKNKVCGVAVHAQA